MKQFLAHVLLIAILVISPTNTFDNLKTQPTTTDPTESVEEDEDSAGLFPDVLQDNYMNGFYQLIEFFQTINSTLTKVRDKLDGLENNMEMIKSQLNRLERSQHINQRSISSQAVTISSLQSRNSKITSTLFKRNPEDFLPSPINGASFNGSTFEGVLAAVPTDYMLVTQIKNYMDVDLTGYQLHLPYGFVVSPAPNNISAKTAEVATFGPNKKLNHAAEPEIGTAGSHKCVTNVGEHSTRTLTVYEGDIFLKVTFETKSYPRPDTLTCEVFKLSIGRSDE
ncbi:unnamed protein product [Allacma fusca]|uniref:Uncharacterized protein n=1 Tax=Allacma fusca TaxID=39272 RepID=A0A8J2PCY6_9HEXA|nr:unnamed protein product [Allacma fusca]